VGVSREAIFAGSPVCTEVRDGDCSVKIGLGIMLLTVGLVAMGCITVEAPEAPDVQATVVEELTRAAPAATPQSALEMAEAANPTDRPRPQPIATSQPIATPQLLHTGPTVAELVSRMRPSLARIITSSGSGSGFVYDRSGLVATNAHVVDCCGDVEVIVNNRRYEGKVLGRDDRADLAVVRLNSGSSFTQAALGNAQQVSVGDEIVALGFPLSLGDDLTATKGIVSSRRKLGGYEYFQHDAPINPGNSGGPLISLDGVVIGMNTSKHTDAEGIGFALSVGEMGDRLASLAGSASAATPRPQPVPTRSPTPTQGPMPTRRPASEGFRQVSAGGGHTCGVRSDDAVVCWGRNDHGQATPPEGQFERVSAGSQHTCGLKVDGSVVCWGSNHAFSGEFRGQKITGDYLGQSTPPSGTFRSIDAGDYQTCGIKTDGQVTCWGATSIFIDPSAARSQAHHDAPMQPTLGEFVQIGVGGSSACGVRTGGGLDCWGTQYFCQKAGNCERTPPSGVFRMVESGRSHTCGIKHDDSVECWSHISGATAISPEGAFQQVSVAHGYTCGVKTDGSAICWLIEADGRSILVGRDYGQAKPQAGTFQQVSAGGGHACGVQTDGSVVCWGSNNHGQATPP